jgi:hypothetical protein
MMSPTISLLTELPETLHSELAQYIEKNPDWDQDRAISVAISLFLHQGPSEELITPVVLETCLV